MDPKKEITPQDAARNNIAYKMFVDSADQNYVVARWCFQHNLALDFFWNAAHSLEKTMKAVLLLNSRSAKSPGLGQPPYNHNLSLLYTQIVSLAKELLPEELTKPDEIEMHWRAETTEAYVARISDDGDANNRYQIYGYVLRPEDLYKLDQVFFAIRRLCCPLDRYLYGNVRHGQPTDTHRQYLTTNTHYTPHWAGSRLAKLTSNRASDELRHAALNHNFPFAPPNYDHCELRCSSSAQNPVLMSSILVPAERGQAGKDADDTIELVDWVTENIHLPKSVVTQLKNAKDKLKLNG